MSAFILGLALCNAISLGVYAQSPFVHPGLLQSREDLARMKRAVAARQEPTFAGFEVFRQHPQSQSNYVMRGPMETVGRNPTVAQSEYDSDANAAYQCAIMWAITGEKAYAEKSKEIINAWSSTLKSITGRDAVLMAGLGPFKMVNAAEVIRYTDAGWSDADIRQTEKHFREVTYPVVKDFAPFANGNWDAAAIKTVMAIGVFCNDREILERGLHYYVNGAGDGCIEHYIINETGQCQESGRDQQHTQLGLGLLAESCEIAWHQGLDLYSYDNNRLLKGFEYTAKYNLGEEVPFVETLDRTGKYHHTKISTDGRGRLRSVYEQVYNHYVNRMGIAAPYTQRAAEQVRPEGPGMPGADHPGFGTMLYTRPPSSALIQSQHPPLPLAGILADGSMNEIKLIWVASVGAKDYTVKRAGSSDGYQVIEKNASSATYTDRSVKPGEVYRYVVYASNSAGTSADSFPAAVCAGLPEDWGNVDIGKVAVAGNTSFDGSQFTIEAAGADIGGTNDQCQFAFTPLAGDGIIVARFVPQPSSQFSKFGLMMRSATNSDAAHISLLLTPEPTGQIEAPAWKAVLLSRDSVTADTNIRNVGKELPLPAVTYGRLTGYCWLKLERAGDRFTGSTSLDGKSWTRNGTATVLLPRKMLIGLSVCSRLAGITTRAIFDHVSVSASDAAAKN